MAENLLYVSAEKVSEILNYDNLIKGMEGALSKFSSKPESGVEQPVRSVVNVKKQDGIFGVMPGYSEKDEALAAKLVTFFPNNKDVPTHNAVILVFSAKNGVPLALVDGDVITTMRTAAVSAVATKHLVNGTPQVLAILGAGVQGKSHYDAMSHLYKFKEVRIWSRTFQGAQKLSTEIGATACHTAEEAVKDADIICTVTSSATPVLKAEWVKPGAHINAVGASRRDWHEIEPKLMNSAVLYVDSREAAVNESGDVILAKAENNIYAEVGEVILGKKEAKKNETTVFKSLGLAIEDVISAKIVLDGLKSAKL